MPAEVHAAPVARHTPLQFDCPVGHDGTQVPASHRTVPPVGAAHTRPHAPQFVTLVVMSWQRPLHTALPDAHTQFPIASQLPPAGEVHAPEVRGPTLHAVLVPEHTIVPVC